jgi:hypothetical protein
MSGLADSACSDNLHRSIIMPVVDRRIPRSEEIKAISGGRGEFHAALVNDRVIICSEGSRVHRRPRQDGDPGVLVQAQHTLLEDHRRDRLTGLGIDAMRKIVSDRIA